VLLALLLAVSPSPLLSDPQITAALGRIEATPGAWVEYAVRTRGKDDARVRATVLEAQDGGRFWIELATVGAGGVPSAARLLLRGTAVSLPDVERIYVMIAGQQPVEVTGEGAAAGHGKRLPTVKLLGPERVRVPAGVFAARAMRVSATRAWRSGEVPLWGLVKARSPRQSVELIAFGWSGGRSVFPPGWDQGKGSESAK
jgi:hypothetical protein